MSKTRIAENWSQVFKGMNFPSKIETYEQVDTALLYRGDQEPFHVTLKIAEVGRISDNGLIYDEELVGAIESQLPGKTGIRGHVPDEALSTAYPLSEAYWVGHLREGKTLWAKAYIPPGDTRDDMRRLMAIGGGIGTSIFGQAVKETANPKKKTWRAKEFSLEQVDLAAPQRAALKTGGAFVITAETEQENKEAEMPEITIADVPQSIREQIIRETAEVAELRAKASRVTELETQNTELTAKVAEAAQWKSIVAEIRGTIGQDTDTVKVITEYHQTLTRLAELMGVPYTNITVKVEEMHEQVQELAKAQFETQVDAEVAKLTNWQVVGETNQKKLNSLRATLKTSILRELGGKREKLAEVAAQVYNGDFQVLAETMRDAMGGPALVSGSHVRESSATNWETLKTPEGIKALREKAGWN